jgi:arylsulfatase B/arylsulfatase I/J
MAQKFLFALLAIRTAITLSHQHQQGKKHIVYMFADDLGWNDVSFHGNTQIPTPHIDNLASHGMQLNQYFVQPVCSPSRATFLTGRHVIHTGVYHAFGNDASGDLSLNFTLLPQQLKRLGYQTHLVGKWHLGYSSWPYTPLRRGFDTTFGYLGGAQDYWLHGFSNVGKPPKSYLDFCDGDEPAFNHTCWQDDACGVEFYSTHLFARKAIKIIEDAAAASAPLFLYIAWQSVHSVEGPDPEQLKAPQSYIDAFNTTIPNMQRRVFAAMTTTLDEGVGNITAALKRTGLWKDTLLIFSTDNGEISFFPLEYPSRSTPLY